MLGLAKSPMKAPGQCIPKKPRIKAEILGDDDTYPCHQTFKIIAIKWVIKAG